jgi:uncharacterized protein
MTPFYVLLSPAKMMDERTRYQGLHSTMPHFLKDAAIVGEALKKLKPQALQKLLVISEALTQQTYERHNAWKTTYTQGESTLAIQLFKGEVYRGLQAETLTDEALTFAQNHIGILSGMYGLLRAKDLVLPYRLMMGTRFAPTKTHSNLYGFWSSKITQRINETVDAKGFLLQLASDEYFKVIDRKTLLPQVLTFDFLECKNGDYKMISTFAKQARGMMARYVIDQRLTTPKKLTQFDYGGYQFQKKMSDETHFVFAR